MKHLTYYTAFIIGVLGSMVWAPAAFAAYTVTDGNLRATFPANAPLFAAHHIVPGFATTTTVTVENIGSETERLYFTATNTSSTGLAKGMQLTAATSGTPAFTGSFANFFQTGSVFADTLAPGDTTSVTLTALFPAATSSNAYQGTSFQFDMWFGFESGAVVVVPGTGGGGGGITTGGFVGNGSNETLPPGQVAGLETSLPFPGEGLVAGVQRTLRELGGAQEPATTGETEMTTATTSTTSVHDAATVSPERATASAAAASVRELPGGCTAVWLVLLGLFSLGWGVFEDRVRNTGALFSALFRRSAKLHVLYFGLLLAAFAGGVLPDVWWLFAGGWAFGMVADFRAHLHTGSRVPFVARALSFAAAGALGVAGHLFAGVPCVWWPFAGVAAAALAALTLLRP